MIKNKDHSILGCTLGSPLLDTTMKRTVMGTANREPQEYTINMMGICLPGCSYSSQSYVISTIFSGFPVRGLFNHMS